MDFLKTLLDNYIIVKEDDKDLYYDIKDNIKSFKTFVSEKLGYNIIIHPDFIKLEKFPGRVESWMGIKCFEDKKDYCLLVTLIMFLEDKGKDEQFILSQLVDYININFEEEKIDWTVYSNRKALVRVLKFAIDMRIIKIVDGAQGSFAEDEKAEVLYENTGISKYIIRNFPVDIQSAKSYRDFINFAWDEIDTERGNTRRNRVYRTIAMSPVMYNGGADDQDFYYVRNYKSTIENDFKKYLGWNLHVHKDAALVVLPENERCRDFYPGASAVSDIVLLLSKMILGEIEQKKLNINENSHIEIKREYMKDMIIELKKSKSKGWSKEYRECSDDKLFSDILSFMKDYNMISEKEDEVIIYPVVGKVIGDYSKNFMERDEKND